MRKNNNRILVLDPNESAQHDIYKILGSEQFSLVVCSQLVDAVKALKETRFKCAIVDIDLPEIPGYRVVPILKAINPALPIILTTETNSRDLEIRVREQDVFFYYIKSFDSQELRLAVLEALRVSNVDVEADGERKQHEAGSKPDPAGRP